MRKRGITGNAWPWLHNWRDRRREAERERQTWAVAATAMRANVDRILRALPDAVGSSRETGRANERVREDGDFYTAMNRLYGIGGAVIARILEAFRAPGPSGEVLAREHLLAPSDLPPWARDRLAALLPY